MRTFASDYFLGCELSNDCKKQMRLFDNVLHLVSTLRKFVSTENAERERGLICQQ